MILKEWIKSNFERIFKGVQVTTYDHPLHIVGVCSSCKYWRLPNNKMGTCLKTIQGWKGGVGTIADFEWEAGIYTGPDYGCIYFEDK